MKSEGTRGGKQAMLGEAKEKDGVTGRATETRRSRQNAEPYAAFRC